MILTGNAFLDKMYEYNQYAASHPLPLKFVPSFDEWKAEKQKRLDAEAQKIACNLYLPYN